MSAAQPAFAQQRLADEPLEVGEWSVTPFIGAGAAGDLENSPPNLGIGLGYNLTPRLMFEGALGYMNAEHETFLGADTSVWTADANLLYHFAERNFVPYVAAGIGTMHASADAAQIDPLDIDNDATELAFNVGGGLKTALTDRAIVRGDVRYYNGDDLAPDFWRFTVGLTFRLGR